MGKIIQVVPRKIIQIAAVRAQSGLSYVSLFALADDGTLWLQEPPCRAEWSPLAPLPDAEACAAVSPNGPESGCQLAKDHRGKQHWNGTRSWK